MNLTANTMYNALLRKDRSFEGLFFAAIKTTGIFCRPTCTARKPKKENVEYFNTAKDALLNGYRPCKVCEPMNQVGETPKDIDMVIKLIHESSSKKIKDYDLVKLGLEPSRIRRWFKQNHGITFHTFQRMNRLNRAYKNLAKGNTVTDTAYQTGYESLSGFGDAFKNILEDSPSKHKHTNIINITRFATPLGPMFACATNEGVCLLEFTDRRMLEFEFKEIKRLLKAKIIYGSNPHLDKVQEQIIEYFEGGRKDFDVPLVTPGTDFQKSVWKELENIPYGKTISYKQQSINLKKREAVRAVARANGFNRIAIIIPCHRVIGENGNLTGYGGGLWRKKWLIGFEVKNSHKNSQR